jgi:tetratricopeptide (TPR) repeat protein
MIASFIVAVGLAWLHATRQERSFAASCILLSLFAIPLIWLFWPTSLKAILANPPEDTNELVAKLEWELASPRVHDPEAIAQARHRLMQLYKARKHYEAAIDQGRKILKQSGLTHAFESQVHLEIAVCLDFLGRDEEAKAEIEAADECLDNRPEDRLGWLVQGRLHDWRKRYHEAAEAYNHALQETPPEDTKARIETLLRLAIASFNAGAIREMLRATEQAVEEGASGPQLISVHNLAGVAASNLVQLDESQQHRQRAYELAVGSEDDQKVSDCLGLLAELELLRGNLPKGEELALEAESICPDSARMAILNHALVLRCQGRTEAALERMEQARRICAFPSSAGERRMQAAYKKSIAVYKAELGRLDEAWTDLREAVSELGKEPRLGLTCEAAWIRLLALQGEHDEAIRRADSLLQALDERQADATTRMECLDWIGRALFEIGEYERSRSCWESELAGAHPPIEEPLALYYLGECHQHLGDPAGALEAFRRAAALGIDSHHAMLAAQRISELSSEPMSS